MFSTLKDIVRRLVQFFQEKEDPKMKEMRGVIPAEYLKQLDLKKRKKKIVKPKKDK